MENSTYKIPLFDLNFNSEEETEIIRTLRSKWISMGDNVKTFEKGFEELLNVNYSIAVTNCTAALHLALEILGIKEGDEVIVPSLTFVATVNAVRYVGGIPVFADITSYKDLSLDPDEIQRKLTKKTKAIIPMHFGGFSCNMDKIKNIADKNNLFIIEDAAHAPLSEYKGKKLGTIGDIGCFSFFSNKNITTAEGGMIVTNNDELAKKAKLKRSHGMTTVSYDRAKGHATKYDVRELGYNYRMDDIRAALALPQLKKLKADVEKRNELRKIYLSKLDDINEIEIPYKDFQDKSSNYIFPIILKNGDSEKRDLVRKKLAERGIETSVHYPAVHRFSIYKEFTSRLPKTEYVSDNEITLPLYYNLNEQNIERVACALKDVLKDIKN
ncbi:MAG TPA: DegT/DnrJ/EryC1/StrS family aminotransferase [Ignavibacteriaceae bacterium]|nr:DegT/DnrJ/EryC1/StrS family aminotransferase [Ignavibacteriaceae bacterium]